MNDDFESMEDESWSIDEDQVDDRTMLVRINAMGWKDAAEGLERRGGDLDFSSQPRRVGYYDPDRMPTLAEAEGRSPEQTPGGYEVLVLRRAYLNANGNATDSAVVALSFSDPQPFFERPDLRGVDPDLQGFIRSSRREQALEQALEQEPVEPARKPRL